MREWLRRTAGDMPQEFWLLWSGNLINRCGSFVFIVLTFYLNQRRGLDPQAVGIVLGLFGAGAAAGVLVGGALADHWGRRGTLLLSQLCTAASVLVLGVVRAPIALGTVGLLFGLAQAVARPVFSAMLIDVVPQPDRVRAFSLTYWSNNLGFVCAAMLGGFLAGLDYGLVFAGDAATTVVFGVLVFVTVGETRPEPVSEHHPSAARSPWRDPVFLGLCALMLPLMTVFQQFGSTLPLSMAHDGLSAAAYGAIMSVNAVVIVLAQPFVPRLLAGRDLSRTLAVAAVLLGLGFGLTTFAHNGLLYAVTVFVWALGEVLMAPGSATLTAELSPIGARGRYQGTMLLASALAAVLAPVAGGFVLNRFGGSVLWPACLVIALVVAALHLVAAPARQHRIAELSAGGEGAVSDQMSPNRQQRG